MLRNTCTPSYSTHQQLYIYFTSIRLPLTQVTKIVRSSIHTIRKDHPVFTYLSPVRTIGSASLQTKTSQVFFTILEEGVHNNH